ncbi:ABC transporter ATP-binding protein [Streptomyces coerulescens]|uniref:ABC transporter ATP-binding protein n=1 Tax=Streptomyces coerulescens TaxID=29304 RepID=A0ABW0CXQ1_STRCD
MSTPTLPVATPGQTWRTVRTQLRGRGKTLAWAVVGLVAGATAATVTPLLVGRIVDIVTAGGTPGQLGVAALAAAAATGLGAAMTAVGAGRTAVLCESVLGSLRGRLVERVAALSLEQVERAGRGVLLQRTVGDVAVASHVARGALPAFVSSVLTILLTAVGLLALDWRLALAGMLPLPVWLLATRSYLRRSAPQYADERTAEEELTQSLLAGVSGARTIRSLRLEGPHGDDIDRRSRGWATAALTACVTRVRFSLRLNAAELLGLLAVFGMASHLVRTQAVSLGAASAAVLLLLRLFEPVSTLLYLLDEVQAAMAALSRLAGVVALAEPADRGVPKPPRDGGITLRGVGFGYTGQDVLHDVEFTVPPGARVAVVGPSGAGKSTVAGLVTGIRVPGRGAITVGGVPASSLDRRSTGLVTQENHVFSGTLMDNLLLARPDASESALTDALSRVGALTWATALPSGLRTPVGAGGHALSTGRAQQLALARLVLADPLVAVLDEPAAESYGGDRSAMNAAIDAALRGRTGIVIAHHLTEARAADRIVVLDAGRVVEQGTHEELLSAGGLYADLWSSWATANVPAGADDSLVP